MILFGRQLFRYLSPFLSSIVFISILPIIRAETSELIIVSPHWEGIQYEFNRAFENYYRRMFQRNIRLHWRDLGGTSQIERALDASFKANPASAGIDVLFGGGLDPYENQKSKNHLQPYRLPEPILEKIPKQLHGIHLIDPDFMFYGATLASFGIVENRKVIEILQLPEVKTWEDLCNPALFGWISSSDPRKSGSVHVIYEIILQAYGWNKGWSVIYQMSANTRSFMQNSSAPTKEVSMGEVAYAITVDVNGLTQQNFLGSDNIRFKIPAGVSIIAPDGIAILKGAPNIEAAQEFLNFALSEEGQSLWMKPRGHPDGPVKFNIARMSVLPNLYQADWDKSLVPLNPFQQPSTFNYSSEKGSKRWNVLNDLIGQTMIDVHSRMKQAWQQICNVPEPARQILIQQFSEPFVTEEEALAISDFWHKDKIRAGHIANEWMARAVQRYEKLTQTAKKMIAPQKGVAELKQGQ